MSTINPATGKSWGRPSSYKAEMDSKVIELMSEGASKAELCGEFGITPETLAQWTDPNGKWFKPSLSEALSIGVRLSEQWWMTKGRVNLENKNFNATLWYMNMRNRFGWRDKVENTVDVTSKGESVALDPALAAEWTEFLKNRR